MSVFKLIAEQASKAALLPQLDSPWLGTEQKILGTWDHKMTPAIHRAVAIARYAFGFDKLSMTLEHKSLGDLKRLTVLSLQALS